MWRVLVQRCHCPQPVGGIVSSLLSRRYINCAIDYSVDIASCCCHCGLHIHVGVNIKQFYKNTAALLKLLSCISSVQRASCCKDIAVAKQELLSISEHWSHTASENGPPSHTNRFRHHWHFVWEACIKDEEWRRCSKLNPNDVEHRLICKT